MTNAAPAELAAVTARINEIRARIGASSSRSAASVTAGGSAFATTLSQALGTSSTEASLAATATGVGTAGTGATATPAGTAAGTSALRLGTTATDGAGGVPVTGDRAVALAAEYSGTPYRWGGTDPSSGLDCSGLTQLVFRRLGVELPRTSAQQARVGTAVASLADARPGDLVFFGSPVHHVGVYAGDGKMIDAPRAGKTVGLHKVWDGVSAIRRVLPDASSATQPSSATDAAAGQVRTMLASMQADALKTAVAALDPASDAAASAGTGDGLTGLSPSSATSSSASATVNQILAAARGFGLSAPGGVMGGAGTHEVSLDDSMLSALSGLTGAASSSATTGAAGASSAAAGASGWRAQPFADLFADAGATYGVDPALLSAIAKAESAYRPTARSHAGAVGLMQLMPGTARGLDVDPTDPAQAVDGAARLVSRYLKTYDGDVDRVLAAYNAGPGAVQRYGGVPPYAETRTYVQRVTGFWKDLS